MPGSPIQEQIRAWIQICGRKVACLEKSQKNETSRPTFASSNLEKPPKGGFFLFFYGQSLRRIQKAHRTGQWPGRRQSIIRTGLAPPPKY
jgi:hypothetical protein